MIKNVRGRGLFFPLFKFSLRMTGISAPKSCASFDFFITTYASWDAVFRMHSGLIRKILMIFEEIHLSAFFVHDYFTHCA